MCQYSRQDPVPTVVVELLQARHRDSDDNEVVRLPTLLTPGTSHRFDLLQRVEPTTKP